MTDNHIAFLFVLIPALIYVLCLAVDWAQDRAEQKLEQELRFAGLWQGRRNDGTIIKPIRVDETADLELRLKVSEQQRTYWRDVARQLGPDPVFEDDDD